MSEPTARQLWRLLVAADGFRTTGGTFRQVAVEVVVVPTGNVAVEGEHVLTTDGRSST